MARKKLTADLNGGDESTPMADLVYQVYDASDDSIIATANYSAIGSVNANGTDGANITYTLNPTGGAGGNGQIILDGIEVGDVDSVKIRCKDLDGNEAPLSASYDITKYYSIASSYANRTYASVVPEQLFRNDGDYFAIRMKPDGNEANGIAGASNYPETAFAMSLVTYFTHYDEAQTSTVCAGSQKLATASQSTLRVETLTPDTEATISGRGISEQYTVKGSLNAIGFVLCSKPTTGIADTTRSYWTNATTEYLDFNGDKVYFKNNTGTHVSESGNITVQLISKGGVVPDLSVLYTQLSGKPTT